MHMNTKFQYVDGPTTQFKNSEIHYKIYFGINIPADKSTLYFFLFHMVTPVHFDQKWAHTLLLNLNDCAV